MGEAPLGVGGAPSEVDIALSAFSYHAALKELKLKGEFVTDTATMCIFDIACLKHRFDDDIDWWSTLTTNLKR
jgi:hypothetical protein